MFGVTKVPDKREEQGFTLIELLIVILIVGILAAVAVPLYLGYLRDSRLAEGKALAGSALTAAEACAQQNPATEATECTVVKLQGKIGLTSANKTGDGRWLVTIDVAVDFDTATQKYVAGKITAAGQLAPVDTMAAAIFIDANGIVTMRCSTVASTVTSADGTC